MSYSCDVDHFSSNALTTKATKGLLKKTLSKSKTNSAVKSFDF